MKRIIASLMATAAVMLGTTVLTVAPAHADTPGCVTQAEFGAVHKGFTRHRVHAIFDTIGKRMSIASGGGYTIEIRSYKTCSPYGAVAVSYTNGRLTAKSGVF